MKAIIVNYRGGQRTQTTNQLVLQLESVSTKEEAAKYLGKKVEWTTPSGKKIVGKLTKPHGKKGAVIARFNKGLPGQALGTQAEVKE